MATFVKFYCFVQDEAHKQHDLSTDQLAVALLAAANAPLLTNTLLSDLTQATYTNLSTRNVTRTSSGQTTGTYNLVLQDLVLTSTGGTTGPFRYVVLYNSANNRLIGYYDYGSDLTIPSGSDFTIDFTGAFTKT
jgi:hypothetical protein